KLEFFLCKLLRLVRPAERVQSECGLRSPGGKGGVADAECLRVPAELQEVGEGLFCRAARLAGAGSAVDEQQPVADRDLSETRAVGNGDRLGGPTAVDVHVREEAR